jgi:hypothetical protein
VSARRATGGVTNKKMRPRARRSLIKSMVREFSTYSGGGLLNRRKNREAAQRTIQPIILTGIA